MNIKLLTRKDFFLLMLGKLVSLIGSQVQNFALSLYVFKITGSATKFASVLIVTMIPYIILGPIAGVFADWFDRKKIIVLFDLIRGIIIGIYACIFFINGSLTLTSIYILVIIVSLTSLVFQPAISTVIPSIVNKEELVDANGINSLIRTLGNLISPCIAGLILGFYDLFLILLINSISFILSAISEMFINIPKNNKKPEKISFGAFKKDFNEGIKFIKNKKIMMIIILLAVIINFAYNPVFSIGVLFISKEVLGVSDFQYGMLQSILVIAMLTGPFICSKVSKKMKLGKILFLDMFIVSILIGIMAVVTSSGYLNLFKGNIIPFISLIAILFLIASIVTVGNIALNTMVQQETPLDMLGRIGTVMSTGCMAAIPLGQMIFGVLYDKIDTWICVAISSIILLVTILVFRRALCSTEEKSEEKKENITNDSNKVETF